MGEHELRLVGDSASKSPSDEDEVGGGDRFSDFLRDVARTPSPSIESAAPALAIGARVGPYEVLGLLGSGGMGEVYRARDDRLDREVAIKVLPASFRENPAWARRFEHEARAAGSLNHPNILSVYDAGTHEGMPYLVCERLVGQTLGAVLRGGKLPIRRALEYGVQVARGLAAAHTRGIVHRDLKPDNLFLTHDGFVKILDFGLAKTVDVAPSSEAGAGSAAQRALRELTHTALATQPGAILGTVGYMSPEQVRGSAVDHRTDLFAFGAILYEMVAGRRAFSAPSAVETMHAILKDEPPDLSQSTADLPIALERLVRHCLEKDPGARFQSAQDVAFHLESILSSSWPSGGAAFVAPAVHTKVRIRRYALAAAVLLVLGGGIAAGYYWRSRDDSPLTRAISLAETLGREALTQHPGVLDAIKRGGPKRWPFDFRQLTFRRGHIPSARFSPDGQTIVFGARWPGAKEGKELELYSTRTDSPGARALGHPGAGLLSISRSGEMAVLLRHSKKDHGSCGAKCGEHVLGRVPLSGGAPREVAEGVMHADWSPDGRQLAIIRGRKGRLQIEYPMGRVLHESAGWLADLRVSPKGDTLAFLYHPTKHDDSGQVAIIDASGTTRVLSEGWMSVNGLAWHPSGNEIWFTAAKTGLHRAIHAVTLDGKLRQVARLPGTLRLQDIAADGRVLVVIDHVRWQLRYVGPDAKELRDLSWFDFSAAKALTPDGKRVLFDESGEGGGSNYSVFIRPTNGGPAVRLGAGVAWGLSPDGRWALAIPPNPIPSQLWLLPTGTGDARQLTRDTIHRQMAQFFPDGKRILFSGNVPGEGLRLWVQPIEGGAPTPIAPEGVILPTLSAVSPDGRLVIGYRAADDRYILLPSDGVGTPRVLPAFGNVRIIRFSSDPRHLLAVRGGDDPALVRVDLETGKETEVLLKPPRAFEFDRVSTVVMTPDGKQIAFSGVRSDETLYLFEGLR
jgi:serine/threonine protein kinase/Tol biopolymer transport system component